IVESSSTLAVISTKLDRIIVHGQEIDEPLFAAIDGDGDGSLAGLNDDADVWDGSLASPAGDKAYYFLNNRMGSVAALLDRDDDEVVIEYYRYRVYGEQSAFPRLDSNTDGKEDTPGNLGDNSRFLFSQSGNE